MTDGASQPRTKKEPVEQPEEKTLRGEEKHTPIIEHMFLFRKVSTHTFL
jgi:hypothetical protein